MNIDGLKTINDIDIDDITKLVNAINENKIIEFITTNLNIRIVNDDIVYFNDVLIDGGISALQTKINMYTNIHNLKIECEKLNNEYTINLNSEILNRLVSVESYQINTKLPTEATSETLKKIIINAPTEQTILHVLPSTEIISVVDDFNKNFENAYANLTVSESTKQYYGIYDCLQNSISTTKNGDTLLRLVNCPINLNFKQNAFSNCTSLVNIIAPVLTQIGANGMFGCTSLNQAYIPTCYSIGNNCFGGCTTINTISAPNIKTISTNFSVNCNSLVNVICPSVKIINNSAFNSCNSLKHIMISTLTTFGNNVFTNITTPEQINVYIKTNNIYDFGETAYLIKSKYPTMNKFYYYNANEIPDIPNFDDSNWKLLTVLLDTTITTNEYYNATFTEAIAPRCEIIQNNAFYSTDGTANTTIKSLICPICVSVGEYAFINCSSLASVDFPRCQTLNNSIFQYCESLPSVNFPECIELGQNIFNNCTKLTSTTFAVCGAVSNKLFSSCTSLASVNFPNCHVIETNAFYGCNALTNLMISTLTTCETSIFASIITPATINVFIKSNNFNNCINTKLLIISEYDDITNFYYYDADKVPTTPTFDDPNWKLIPTDLTVLSDTTIIQNEYYNATFTSAIAPKCEIIQNFAFYSTDETSNTTLTSINCPVCKRIGISAFNACEVLTTADFPECKLIDNYAFDSCGVSTINFPKCELIGISAFNNCRNLYDLDFPECKLICIRAFCSCDGLCNVNCPNCLTIERNAFQSCMSLTNINFSKCNMIGYRAFRSCKLLTEASFPDCLILDNYVFQSCITLDTAYFPNCGILGNRTFMDCARLKNVMISSLTSIGDSPFFGTMNLTIYINTTNTTDATETKNMIMNYGYEDMTFKYYSGLSVLTYPDFNDPNWITLT